MTEPTSDAERSQIVQAGGLLARSLRVTGAEGAADTVEKLVELAYEDGSRGAFYTFASYRDAWEQSLRERARRED